MSYLIVFLTGFALGSGIAVYIYLKNKWARDELVQAKATIKVQERMREILVKKLPRGKRNIIDSLSEPDSTD